LLRLVNGILDPQQAKQHAQSIASLAKQVNMPRILVDLRHEATHQQLPSLPLLQYASLAALEWLQRHYWAAQAHALSKTDDALRTQLRAYKKARERSAEALGADVAAARAARDAEVSAAVSSGDTIMLLADSSNTSGPASASAPPSALPERAQSALKLLFSALTSGYTVSHSRSVVEGKLVPQLLSTSFLLKPPRQSRVSVGAVAKRLVQTWEPALLFLTHRLRSSSSQQINLLALLLDTIVQRLSAAPKQQQSATQQSWELDLSREWAMHLLQNHAALLFKDERSPDAAASNTAAATATTTPSKKRSHASMAAAPAAAATQQASDSSSRTSLIDALMHRCLKHLNPWLASLLPLLLPLFKQAHQQSPQRAEQIAQLEMLLHVTTRALYPNQRMAAPTNGAVSAAGGGAASAAASSSALPPPRTAFQAQQTLASVRAFLAERASAANAESNGALATSGHFAAGASAAAAAGALPQRVLDFPFLPLGLSPGCLSAEDSLWIEDGM
jgi:hypothetical protein